MNEEQRKRVKAHKILQHYNGICIGFGTEWNGMELISQNICDSKISNLGKLYSYTYNKQTNKQTKNNTSK